MNQIEIRNAKKFDVEEESIRSIIFDTLTILEISNTFTQVSLVSESEIARLNTKYRSIDHATDVLSFPQLEVPGAKIKILGDLVISMSIVKAKNETLSDVVKHGLLHLLGHDHENNKPDWDKVANKINCKY